MSQRSLEDHLFGPGPKRILALDGGGIRGILTLQFLKRIEEILRQRRDGDPSFRLSDYFDLIGGTSTGAIIAAGLAKGYSVAELDQLYRSLGKEVFKRKRTRLGVMRAKFPTGPLRKALEQQFGDARIGDSQQIRTGLAVVTKRLDTGSPWVIHNNPKGKYFEGSSSGGAFANKDYLVTQVVRASTAAPSFFDPEAVKVSKGVDGVFVDGGVSPHNNPALQLFMLTTLKGHRLNWRTGEDELQIVSVGTGSWNTRLSPQKVLDQKALVVALRSLTSMMDDASALNEQVLQFLSRSPTARSIDREVGDLKQDLLGDRAWLSYLRYDAWIEKPWLLEQLGLPYSDKRVEAMRKMDRPGNLEDLAKIGDEAAKRLVKPSHLARAFDIE